MSDGKPVLNTDDIYVCGIEKATYEELLKIGKKKNVSVTDVVSEALRKVIIDNAKLSETTEKKILTEG